MICHPLLDDWQNRAEMCAPFQCHPTLVTYCVRRNKKMSGNGSVRYDHDKLATGESAGSERSL